MFSETNQAVRNAQHMLGRKSVFHTRPTAQ